MEQMDQLKGFELNTSLEFLKDDLGGIGAFAMRDMLIKDHSEQSQVDDSKSEIYTYSLK